MGKRERRPSCLPEERGKFEGKAVVAELSRRLNKELESERKPNEGKKAEGFREKDGRK